MKTSVEGRESRVERALCLAIVLSAIAPALLGAQENALLRGRVLLDTLGHPLAGATVAIPTLNLSVTSDSLGRFRMPAVKAGTQTVLVRHLGYGPIMTELQFKAGDSLVVEFELTPTVQELPGVAVKAAPHLSPKMAEFEGRRLEGHGRFLTQADIEKRPGSVLSNILRQLPGLEIVRAGPNEYVAAGRMSVPACAFCGAASGAPAPCYAAVAIDGAFVFTGNQGEPKFEIKQIQPSIIAGIEYYAGPASMPVKYNGTRGTCGLLLIWTK